MANKRSGRTRLLLVSLLVTSLFLVTLDLRGVSLVNSLRNVTQSVLAPFQSLGSSILKPIGDFFGGFSDLRNSSSRIAELERENESLRVKAILNENIAGELKQLKGVLDLAGKGRYKTVSARVISKGGTATISESIVIDQGSQAGITRDMTVIAESGLVGVVKSTTTCAAEPLSCSSESPISRAATSAKPSAASTAFTTSEPIRPRAPKTATLIIYLTPSQTLTQI